ncbi:MAG TPA: hypothetical protein VN939_01745 [Chthoniobacterales bacterium]|nr:hypothetical protein [Chthoniobacterales bacterium]
MKPLPDPSSKKKVWRSWLIVVVLGLVALISPHINHESVKPKLNSLPTQSDQAGNDGPYETASTPR